ncbi:pyocin knob domain-containing protein, partial [Paenibacillus popilliae]
YVEVIAHNPEWVLQKVYGLYANQFYMRRLTNTGWTPWTQDLYTWQKVRVTADDGNATMTGDLNADLSTGWYQVVDAP